MRWNLLVRRVQEATVQVDAADEAEARELAEERALALNEWDVEVVETEPA